MRMTVQSCARELITLIQIMAKLRHIVQIVSITIFSRAKIA